MRFDSIKYLVPPKRHVYPALAAIALSVAVVPAYLSRKPPVEFLGMRLANDRVEQGDKLELIYGYRVIRPGCESRIHIQVFDNTERVRLYEGDLNDTVEIPEDNGPEVFTGMIKYVGVPIHARAGSASAQIQVTHRCNILHYYWPITQNLTTQEFTIAAKLLPQEELQKKIEELEKKVPLDGPPPELQIAPQPTKATTLDPNQEEAVWDRPEYKPPVVTHPVPERKPKKIVKKKEKRIVQSRPRILQTSAPAPEEEISSPPAAQQVLPPKQEELPAWLNNLFK